MAPPETLVLSRGTACCPLLSAWRRVSARPSPRGRLTAAGRPPCSTGMSSRYSAPSPPQTTVLQFRPRLWIYPRGGMNFRRAIANLPSPCVVAASPQRCPRREGQPLSATDYAGRPSQPDGPPARRAHDGTFPPSCSTRRTWYAAIPRLSRTWTLPGAEPLQPQQLVSATHAIESIPDIPDIQTVSAPHGNPNYD